MTREEILTQEILTIKTDITQNNLNQEAIINNQQLIIEMLRGILDVTEAQAVYTAAMTDTLIGKEE